MSGELSEFSTGSSAGEDDEVFTPKPGKYLGNLAIFNFHWKIILLLKFSFILIHRRFIIVICI